MAKQILDDQDMVTITDQTIYNMKYNEDIIWRVSDKNQARPERIWGNPQKPESTPKELIADMKARILEEMEDPMSGHVWSRLYVQVKQLEKFYEDK